MAFRLLSFRTAVAVLAISSLAACSDDKKSDPTPSTGVSWTVDGSNVTATQSIAASLGNDLAISATTGSTAAANSILLSIPKHTGTFTITGATADEASAVYQVASSDFYEGTTGSIVVTTYSASNTAGASNVAGTFTFTGTSATGTGTKTLTNGKFNIKY